MKHPSLAQISFAITALFFAAAGEAQPATLLTLSPPEVIYDGEDGVLSLHRTATRVFVDARGTAYLPDWKDGGVFAFSPDARTPRRVGGKGSGPGEFIGASALGWLGDTLWVSDSRNNRITMIARWGQGLPRTLTFSASNSAFGINVPSGLTRSGLAVAQRSSPYTRDRERNARESRRVPVLSLTRDGLKTLDTLFFLNLANRTHEVIVDNGEGVFLGTQPFVGQDLWQMSSNGEYIVTVMQPTLDDAAAEVSLVLRRSDGQVLFRNNLPMPKTSTPRAAFERRADSLLKEMNTGRDGRNTNEFSRASFYQNLIIPRTPPQVTKVMVSASGMVLVRGDDLGVAAVRHSIWSAGGTLVGTFTLPPDQMVCGFSGDKLWSVVDRADGSMHLVTQRFGQRTDPNRTPYETGARFRGSDR